VLYATTSVTPHRSHCARSIERGRGGKHVDFQRGRGITVAGTPERSAVVKRVRDLVDFCRTQGYRPDEVIQIIEGLS